VHEADASVFEDLANFITVYGEDKNDEEKQQWTDFMIDTCNYVPRKCDRFLRDGEVIEFGEVSMEVIHTPGHTPGHCAFYFPKERILFTADLDLVRAGPYYGDTISSLEDTISSLSRLASYSCDIYLTSHGKGIYEGDPLYIQRYLGSIHQREQKLIEFLRTKPRTLDEITAKGIIYGPRKEIASIWNLSKSERVMMQKHLELLMKRGLIVQEEDRFVYTGNKDQEFWSDGVTE
jgi:glyoxylase-like metal-dependent hydrolase (beta-lactamase superfamily II)